MKSYGILNCSPKTHLASNKNWMVLMCDESLVKYYSHLFNKEYPWLSKLQRPVWGAHISVIRGEKAIQNNQWELFNKKRFDFDYEPGVIDNGEYYWLNVKCEALLDIREMYGLPRQPKFGLHLTVGRTTDVKQRIHATLY